MKRNARRLVSSVVCLCVVLLGAPPGLLSGTPVASAAAARAPLDGTRSDVYSFGSAAYLGANHRALAADVAAMMRTRTGAGYWLVARDGGVFAFGRAGFYGSTGNLELAQPIVGAAATPAAKGYWLVAADGGVFAFGDGR